MKLFKQIFLLTALAAGLLSCQKEECPTPFCTMKINFTLDALEGETELPVSTVDIFLKNEKLNQIYGPIAVDLTKAETVVGESGDTKKYILTVNQPLPYGDYSMWAWVNVSEQEGVYSFGYYTINLVNNYIGAEYMVCKPTQVSMSERSSEMDMNIERLTAQVNIDALPEGGVTLYVSDVYKSVNAEGVFSTSTTFEFDNNALTTIPPSTFYTFPTVTGESSQLHYTFFNGVENETFDDTKTFLVGESYSVNFSPI